MKTKNNFYISAIYTSAPNTMGGNTKIMVEMINNLINEYNFIVFTTEPEAFRLNIKHHEKIKIISIPFNFTKFSLTSHFKEVDYIYHIYFEYFKNNPILKEDFFYSCSDFAPDVLPIFRLKKIYKFQWIPTLFLFIPNPIENLLNHYGFPFFKYILYYFYQKYIFSRILKKGDKFIITNDHDRNHFPKNIQKNILAIYGGVNPEQIHSAKIQKERYDAVFCSRLHPQKGLERLLMMWSYVVKNMPSAKLALIGNGEKTYERKLKLFANKLNIRENITWLGYVNGVEKFNIYKSSRLFIHATVYDNNGMVAAEALCTGLPVIMFDLSPLKRIYTEGCVKIPPYDNTFFSKTVIQLLKDKKYFYNIKPDLNIIRKLTNFWKWENRSKIIHNFLTNNNPNE